MPSSTTPAVHPSCQESTHHDIVIAMLSRRATEPPRTFPRFRDLPIELQIMIFEQFIESCSEEDFPMLGEVLWRMPWCRSIRVPSQNTVIRIYVPKHMGEYWAIVSLLQTCKLSSDVFREWWAKKLKLRADSNQLLHGTDGVLNLNANVVSWLNTQHGNMWWSRRAIMKIGEWRGFRPS